MIGVERRSEEWKEKEEKKKDEKYLEKAFAIVIPADGAQQWDEDYGNISPPYVEVTVASSWKRVTRWEMMAELTRPLSVALILALMRGGRVDSVRDILLRK